MRIDSVRSSLRIAQQRVYGVRMGISVDKVTPEQAETIMRIEKDLTDLINSLKGGWSR